jgi:hypothetical protein
VEDDAQASFEFDFRRALVRFHTPTNKAEPIQLQFDDGGNALIHPGTSACLDRLYDDSYYFFGKGSLIGTNSDGQTIPIAAISTALLGGPLPPPDPARTNRIARLLPPIDVKITGSLGAPLLVEVGTNSLQLSPGEIESASFTNGSHIEFTYDVSQLYLRWRVDKGYFRVTVVGIDGWKAITWVDQWGEIQWNPAYRLIHLRNLSASSPILVTQPNRTLTVVQPKASYQYAYVKPGTFTTSASGGSVVLHNLDSRESFSLRDQNLVFVSGRASGQRGDRPVSSSFQSLSLIWDHGAPAELTGMSRNASILPKEEKLIVFDEHTKVLVRHTDGGELIIKSLEGSYRLTLPDLNGISIDLPDGQETVLRLDLKKGTFVIMADPENSEDVKVATVDGFAPPLPPSTAMNFNIGKNGSVTATSNGKVVFYESAGVAPSGTIPGTRIPVVIQKDELDIPRIPQPPVSGFR